MLIWARADAEEGLAHNEAAPLKEAAKGHERGGANLS